MRKDRGREGRGGPSKGGCWAQREGTEGGHRGRAGRRDTEQVSGEVAEMEDEWEGGGRSGRGGSDDVTLQGAGAGRHFRAGREWGATSCEAERWQRESFYFNAQRKKG